MIDDSESREVAKLLRERAGYEMGCVFKELYGDCNSAGPSCGECNERAMRYIADLIEPSGHECVPGECPINVRHDNDRIDRDALLVLVDDLERPMRDGGYSKRIASRIREALGVTDEN